MSAVTNSDMVSHIEDAFVRGIEYALVMGDDAFTTLEISDDQKVMLEKSINECEQLITYIKSLKPVKND